MWVRAPSAFPNTMKLSQIINNFQELCNLLEVSFEDIDIDVDSNAILLEIKGRERLTEKEEAVLDGLFFNSEEWDCIAHYI